MLWSSLSSGSISFNPVTDVLDFDGGISAAGITFTFISGTSSTFSDGVKTVTLLTAPETLTTANITFQDGSQLIVGDNNVVASAADNVGVTQTGTSNHDQLVGLGGDDTLTGGAGNDLLRGNDRQDILDGGIGADTMIGGDDGDFYFVDDAGDVVSEAATSGTDIVVSSASNYTLPGNVENLTLAGSSAIHGTGNGSNNIINGNTAANSLDGSSGDDWLIGGGGADTLIGGAGNDLYSVDSTDDVIVESSGALDEVYVSADYTVAAGVENIYLEVAAAVTGNSSNNLITGSVEADTLVGAGGADTLIASSGDDVLQGDGGNDYLDGSIGNDTAQYTSSSAGHSINVVNGNVVVTDTNPGNGDDGTDTLVSVENISFADGIVRAVSLLETRVNTTTTSTQGDPSIAVLADGGHVVIWRSFHDGNGGIYGQRYSAGGATPTSEFTVDDTTAVNPFGNSVAALPDGGFVVTWSAQGGSAVGYDIYTHRYDADGAAVGFPTIINSATADNQVFPVVAALEGGGYVVAWQSFGQDGSDYGIYARRFDADGTAAEIEEFRVNVVTANAQSDAAIAGLTGGGFVVTWQSYLQDGSGNGVYARIYDDSGTALGSGFRVSTTTFADQDAPSIAALGAGGFVVVWTAGGAQDGSSNGVFGQRFLGNGTAVGGEFLVNTFNAGDQSTASVSALSDGGFVVAWQSNNQDGNGYGIYAQRYDAGGSAVGSEIRVHTTTAGDQITPAVAALNDGGFVVAWASPDGDQYGIYSQRFDAGGNAIAAELTGDAGDNALAWSGGGYVVLDGGAGNDTLAGGSGNDVLAGGTGADSMDGGGGDDLFIVENTGDVAIDSGGGTADRVESSVTFTLTGNIENLTLTGTDSIHGTGNASNNMLTGNIAANSLDGGAGADTLSGGGGADTLVGGAGNDLFVVDSADDVVVEVASAGADTVRASVAYTLSNNVENLVLLDGVLAGTGSADNNSITGSNSGDTLAGAGGADTLVGGSGNDVLQGDAGNDRLDGGAGNDAASYQSSSAGHGISVVGGNFVITDTNPGNGDDGVDTLVGVEGVAFADGTIEFHVHGEHRVNTFTATSQNSPVVATLADGGYVVTWTSAQQDSSFDSVWAQRYYADGTARGDEFSVSGPGGSGQRDPSIAALEDGGFVIAWESGPSSISARRYDDEGAPGSSFLVNLFVPTNSLAAPAIAALPDGGFVVVWETWDTVELHIIGRRYSASGEGDDEFQIDTTSLGNFSSGGEPSVSALAEGFVVAWDRTQSVDTYLRIYDDSGAVGNDFLADAAQGFQQHSQVVALADDDFLVLWYGGTVSARRFHADGTPAGASFQINTSVLSSNQPQLAAALLADGGFVVVWTANDLSGFEGDIFGQRFNANGATAGGEFRINATTSGDQISPSVAALADGGFVVAWQSPDSNSYGIYAQRFDAAGNAIAAEFTGDANGNAIAWTGSGTVEIDGGGGNDTLGGGAAPDALEGGIGSDSLSGGAGNDELVGGPGADSMEGGLGNDRYSVDHAGDTVTENSGAGTDLVESSVSFTLSGNVEHLTLIGGEAINGTGNTLANLITGNTAANFLDGGAGADTLTGGGGADTLSGGTGPDLYIVDSADDVVVETGSDADTIRASVDYTLPGGVEHLVLVDGADAGTGNSVANVISGGANNDSLIGLGGADTLRGGTGEDTLRGDSGNDLLDGGAGNDVASYLGSSSGYDFRIVNGNVVVTDLDSSNGSDGIDTLVEIERVSFSDGTVALTALTEFRVNTTTESDQANPAVAALPGGGYVLAWQSLTLATNSLDVFAQRYEAGGAPAGAEFMVNGTTPGFHANASMVALSEGGFLVTWDNNPGILGQRYGANGAAVGGEFAVNSNSSNVTRFLNAVAPLPDDGFVAAWVQGGTDNDIYARRFDGGGGLDADFRVNSTTTNHQTLPSVASFADGSFVVAWGSLQGGVDNDVYARRFDADGNAPAVEFRVNTTTLSDQSAPVLAALDDGSFVVVWRSVVSGSNEIYAQRYDASGAVGSEFRVNTTTTDSQVQPAVARLADGGFVVEWSSLSQDGGDFGVYSQRYDAAGQPVGGEVRVNTTTVEAQRAPAVAGLSDGGWVATWQSNLQDGSGLGIYAQRYGADGLPMAAQFEGDAGNNVVRWVGTGTVFLNGGAGNDTLGGGTSNDVLDGGSGADSMNGGGGDDFYVVDNTADVVTEGSLSGSDSVESSASFTLAPNVERLTLTGSAAINGAGNTSNNFLTGNSGANSLDGGAGSDTLDGGAGNDTLIGGQGSDLYFADSTGDVIVESASQGTDHVRASVSHTLANDVENLTLLGTAAVGAGNALNNVITGSAGANTLIGGGNPDTLDGAAGDDAVVYSGSMTGYSLAISGGTFVVTDIDGGNGNDGVDTLLNVERVSFADGTIRPGWTGEFEVSAQGTLASTAMLPGGGMVAAWWGGDGEIHARRYGASGIASEDEFGVNTTVRDLQQHPAVAALSDGSFVVTWQSNGQDGSSNGVYAQRYDAASIAQGGEFRVNTTTGNSQAEPAIVALADGGFFITWTSTAQDEGSTLGIYGQRYDDTGAAVDEEIRVNTTTAGDQARPALGALGDGGYVVVWESNAQDSTGSIYAQRYAANGDPLGTEIRINTITAGQQSQADVAGLADGGFVVVWESPDDNGNGIFAQRFNAAGTMVGGEFRANSTLIEDQQVPAVTALAGGGFVVTWASETGAADGEVFGQRFDAQGMALGGEFRASANSVFHGAPDVSALPDGGFVLTWSRSDGIYAQRFDAAGNPVSLQLAGDAADNVLAWSSSSSVLLDGGAGNDALTGGAGNDFLTGGIGADTLIGGAGDDTYVVDSDLIVEAAGGGRDTVRSDSSYTLGANLENLVLTGTATAAGVGNGGDNAITGNQANNALDGGAGNDTLNGTGGNDTLTGGSGNDVFMVDSVADVVMEEAEQGTDTVLSSVSFALPANAENLVLLDGALNGVGNGLANLIVGNRADNNLTGGAGNDTLVGGDGSDTATLGASTASRFSLGGGGIVVSGPVGVDVLVGIEDAEFSDGAIALAALGEFRANTYTADNQLAPSIAVLADGGFVISWQSSGQDGSQAGIYAQRYDDMGVAIGREIHVSTATALDQADPSVTGLVDGGFLVAWTAPDATGTGIYAQRFDGAGDSVGAEFRVNAGQANGQSQPAVTALTDGGFALAWTSAGGLSDPVGVYVRRYDAEGLAQGVEIPAVGASSPNPHSAVIAALPDGGFVVAAVTINGGESNIRAERFDASGGRVVPELLVSIAAGEQAAPAIAAVGDGFVVAWVSEDADGTGIYARRYGAGGNALTGEFQVNTASANAQLEPVVAGFGDGGFVIAWRTGNGAGNGHDIHYQRYDADSVALGGEARANATAAGAQEAPALAVLPDGSFVISWQSDLQDGSGTGVYAQRFDASGNPVGAELDGDGGNNFISWNDAASAILEGNSGSDTIEGGTGNDSMDGGSGTDTLSYANAAAGVTVDLSLATPQATGGAGVDMLVDFEHIRGSAFGDRLAGTAGANLLSGGGGSDTLVAGPGGDTLDGGAGTDFADFSGAAGPLTANLGEGGVGGYTFLGIEAVIGTGLNDTLVGDGSNNVFDGGAGTDSMTGGAGDDRYVVDNAGDVVAENLNEGTDQIDSSISLALPGNVENLLLTGGGAISGTGNGDINVITGNANANTLDGAAGADTLAGGAGNDVFIVSSGGGVDRITDFEGGDAIRVTGLAPTLPFGAGSGTGLGANQVSVLDGEGITTLFFGIDTVTGADASVELSGSFAPGDFRLSGNDIRINAGPILNAALDDDVVPEDEPFTYTFAANSFLDFDGDTLAYTATRADNSALPAWLSFTPATRTFSGTPSDNDVGTVLVKVTASDGAASVSDVFALTITNDDEVVEDTIAGAHTLDGGAGGDTMVGNDGNDFYIVNNAGDVVIETSNVDTDEIQASVTYTLPDRVEVLVLTGSGAINGTGNDQDNTIIGNAAANRLTGGLGIDSMTGGGGNDTYVVQNSNDQVSEALNGGTDTVETSTTYTLPANVENITLLADAGDISATGNTLGNVMQGNEGANSLIGGAGNDTLFGGAGNDTLDGGAGNDSMAGGDGDDLYLVDSGGDVVSESASQGIDLVSSSVSYTLGANQEHLFLRGTDSIDGTGNTLSNQIFGNAAANVLRGGDGDDLLRGEGGADTMIGGTGNDLYYVDNTGDTVQEGAAPGDGSADRVIASVDFTLPDNVEQLTIVDVNALFIVGNGLNNFFQGGAGSETFVGGGGDDSINAGNGDNRIDGGEGNDEAVLNGTRAEYATSVFAEGEDDERIYFDGGFHLAPNELLALVNQTGRVDRLVGMERVRFLGANLDSPDDDEIVFVEGFGGLVESAASRVNRGDTYRADASGAGSAMSGGAGNDILDGLSGADTLEGNAGNDVLLGGNGDDRLDGGAGNDALDGQNGSDTLVGGAGSDNYIVDSYLDQVIEAAGMGAADRVQSKLGVYSLAGLPNIEVLEALAEAENFNGTGNAAANLLIGKSGSDTLAGGIGNDSLKGNTGNDWLDGGAGNDYLEGGTGNDRYIVDNAADVVDEFGGGGLDTIATTLGSFDLRSVSGIENLSFVGTGNFGGIGTAGQNFLQGGTGNDTLDGLGGVDTLVVTGGRSSYAFGRFPGEVRIVTIATGETDVLRNIELVLFTDSTLPGALTTADILANTPSVLADTLTGGAGNDYLDGLAGNDTLIGNGGDDRLIGGAGNDVLTGGAGNDRYELDSLTDVVNEALNAGTDTVLLTLAAAGNYTLAANVENLELGGTANVNATGNALNNRMTGNAGNNSLVGGVGNDTYVGSAGNDTYALTEANDSIDASGGDDGIDTAFVSVAAGTAGSYLNLAGNEWLENVTYLGAGAVTLLGNAQNNALTGNAGVDALYGAEGNDTLDGGAGNDVMDGGAGNDTYVVNVLGDQIIDSSGVDTVLSLLASYTLAGGSVIENVTLGAAALNATGNEGDNRLEGNALANVLTGAGGNDTLIGGAGSDRYVVDSAGDVVIETMVGAAGGADTVQSSVDFDLWGTQIEHALLVAGAGDTLGGNDLANQLTGAANNDTLQGLGGNDTLTGNAGDDWLAGGTGNDLLTGGAGNDRYELDSLTDVVNEALNAGTDTVLLTLAAAGNYTLAANVEVLELGGTANVNATGNALNNRMTGNSGHNSLVGGVGNDTYAGGGGNDTYGLVDANDSIDGSAGDAGVDTALVSVATGVAGGYLNLGDKEWLENLAYLGTGAVTITGNTQNNALTGNAGADTLLGGAGNDVLDGGLGNDVMNGGADDDTYVINVLGDQIIDSSGVDTVLSLLASYTLAGGSVIENVTLGAAALNATGNEGDNRLEGNALANVLTGAGGNDTLIGGAGSDRYVVDSAGDVVIETMAGAAGGADTVQSSVDFDLWGTQIEHALLVAGAGDTLGGNDLANQLTGAGNNDTLQGLGGNDTLTGNAGDDWLAGGTGNDLLTGGAGNDRYELDSLTDVVNEALNAGTDTVLLTLAAAGNYTLAANVENLELGGTANVNATGNALNNRMTGNSGHNSLVGGAGNDTYVGSAGNDSYRLVDAGDSIDGSGGDDGSDLAIISAGTGAAGSFLNLTGKEWLEHVIYVGTGAVTITGNAQDNALTGNAGADTISGGIGNDTLDGAAGIDVMDGGAGNDSYVVDATGDLIIDSSGVDVLYSLLPSYTLPGGSPVEVVALLGGAALNATGNEGDNRLEGNALGNVLTGAGGSDTLIGFGGNDRYVVDSLGDVVIETMTGAAGGADTVQASVDFDLTGTQIENAQLLAGVGDQLTGNALANQLTGAGNNDTLIGGAGNDTLAGGLGADHFVFDAAPGAGNVDRIADFSAAQGDRITLDNDVFSALGAPGALAAGALRAGVGVTSAADGDDRILYNSSTGALFYDADGAGGAAAVQIATLAGPAPLVSVTATIFEIVD